MVLNIVLAVVASLISLLFSLLVDSSKRSERKGQTLQTRISELTKNLDSAVATISEIEQEIMKRKELITQQENEAERYQQLLELNKSQVEAIAQTISIPIKKESNKSFLLNILTSFFIAAAFFALGFLVRGA